MFNHPNVWLEELGRVVFAAKLARIEQDSQDLWVCPRGPLRQQEQAAE